MDHLNIFNMHVNFIRQVALAVLSPAVCHLAYIPLKVCVLVVQIRPWHVPWLSPLLQLVS